MTTPSPDPQQPAQLAEPLADPNLTVADLSGDHDAEPLSRAATLTQLEGPPPEMAHPVVPGYQILEVLGRGGMGVVYKARQVGLYRLVALKMILGAAHASQEEMVRFIGEAEAVARLQHTNIVQIYQIGRQGELPFFSLEYIDGGSLGQRLHGVPQQPRDAAQLVECLARAIHLAHQKGIVHRDLKPNNILLTLPAVAPCADGDTPRDGPTAVPPAQPPLSACTPKITDFGLAKHVEGGSGLTQTGAIMGTPSYMAPEQAEAKKNIGPAADIYALGAILYEMLTGRPPFRGPTPLDTVLHVLSDEPVSPTRLQPGCPRDLETICLKCLHKEPAKRYATAEALADDLQRFLTDRPILARRTGSLERTRRWCRRNPVLATMTAALALLLIVLAVGASGSALWLRKERNDALDSRDRAEKAEQRRTEQLATSYLEQARARRYSREVGQHFQSLAALAEAAQIVRGMNLDDEQREKRLQELRTEAIACLPLVDLRPQRRLGDVFIQNYGTGFSQTVAFTPTWDIYARAEMDGPISIRSMADDREIKRLPGHGSSPYSIAFSPDGRYLVAKYYRKQTPVEYLVWDWNNNDMVVQQACASAMSPTVDFAFTPDSQYVFLGCRPDGGLACYDLTARKEVRRLDMGGQSPWTIALHPEGRLLAATFDREVRIYDAQTGAVLGAPWRLPDKVWSLAWCRGTNLLAAGYRSQIRLLDAVTRSERGVLEGHEAEPIRLAFNPAGTLLASNSWDNTTRLWDPNTGKELLHVLSDFVDFSPDGQRLAYIKGTEFGIWEVADVPVCRQLVHPATLHRVEFSPNDRLMASATDKGTFLWDVARGKQLAQLDPYTSLAALFDPSGDRLTVVAGNRVNRWLLRPAADDPGLVRVGPPIRIQLLPLARHVSSASMDAGGHRLAVMDSLRRAIVVDLDGTAEPIIRSSHPDLNYLALSPNGRWLATWTFKGEDVKVWDLADQDNGRPAATLPAGDRGGAYFSPDGRWLVVDYGIGKFERSYYRVGSWVLARREIGTDLGGPSFTADGMMATPSQGGREVRLLDPATGYHWATLPSLENQHIRFTTFSRDGTRLAACTDYFVQLWDLRALRGRLAEIGLDWNRDPYPPASPAAERPLAVTVEGVPGAPPPPPSVVILPSIPKPRPAKPDEIAAWVRQLDDAADKVRQTAADALLAVGTPAVEALKAAADGPDGPRRKQARLVLDRIAVAEALAPTRVRLKLDDALPADAIKGLAERSGISMTYVPPPEGVAPKRISLDVEGVSVWEALDRICEAGDLGYSVSGQSAVQVSSQIQRPTATRAYLGPFRLYALAASYRRTLSLVGQNPRTLESLQLQLGLIKEPHTQLLSVQSSPRLTEATDMDGQSLLPAVLPVPMSRVVSEERLLTTPLVNLLKLPERRGGRLKVLKGVLSVEVMARPQDLVTVPNLAKAKGQTFRGDQGHRVTVYAVQTVGREWTVKVRLIGPPGWRYDVNQHALELVDAQGRAVRFSNFVLTPLLLREPQPEDLAWLAAAPQALPWPALAMRHSRLQWQEWDGTLHLLAPIALEEPVKLRVYRFERLQAELPFELHDVPLP